MVPRGNGTVLSRTDLAKEISDHTPGLDVNGARQLVDIVVGEIAAGLRRSGDVTVPSLGRFRIRTRAARRGVNPHSGEPLEIAAKKVISVKASKHLENRVFDDAS